MDPIITPTLIWAVSNYLAAHTIVAVVVAVALLTLSGLAEWFKEREGILEKNKDALAFTLGSMIDNKQYVEIPGLFSGKPGSNRIIQGIYDKRKGEIVAMRAVAAQSLDPEIAKAHSGQRLAIYSRAA